ncbi:MAG: protein phosphatase 2C domain-containing protein [Betaproteobacteria bacterium]|nr:protein phosphatase 2C domain-containing protein [Betaproteobacteria bacterium]
MTWRIAAASEVGTSHSATGGTCQDSCLALVESDPNKSPFLTLFVADGAGSALLGGTGAQLAMESAAAFVARRRAQTPECALDHAWAVECIAAIRAKILAAASQNAAQPRDYACTFLGVIASPAVTLLMQIGDGAIVIDIGHGLEVPITPMAGEYVNMTHFVTDNNAIDILAVTLLPARADKIAVFSDGLQRLALNMETHTAHAPFFAPFFTALAAATQAQEAHLQNGLTRFLQSQAVNDRTDDDKTLALAYWVG